MKLHFVIVYVVLVCLCQCYTSAQTTFQDQALSLLNNMRTRNKVNPLRKNEELTRDAQKWAEYMAKSGYFDIGHEITLSRSSTQAISRQYGLKARPYTAQEVINSWYDNCKVKLYLFNNTLSEFGVGRAFSKIRSRWYATGNFW